MAIMYLAESPLIPDIETDYYLSPLVAPPEKLARFPKTYLLCGERDPLVDDTVVFANLLRNARSKAHHEWERMKTRLGTNPEYEHHSFSKDPEQMVQVKILPGLSHGFFQMYSILPESRQATKLTAGWLLDLFNQTDDPQDSELTELMTAEIAHVEESSILQRRRTEMASAVFPTPNSRAKTVSVSRT